MKVISVAVAVAVSAGMVGISSAAYADTPSTTIVSVATVAPIATAAPSASAVIPARAITSEPQAFTVAAGGALVRVPQPNESAGNYVYVCVLATGSSYTIAHGTRLSSCGGTRIQQYLYGSLQQIVRISGYPPTVNVATVTIGCLIAGAALAVGVWAVITSLGTLTVVSRLVSVAGLAYCAA